MQPFLDRLAEYLLTKDAEDLHRYCIVFPNRRAGLFFRQHLSKRIGKPIWLPQIYALEDFVMIKSDLRLADPLILLVKLYKQLQSLEDLKTRPFSEFLSWGRMILADFDELDQNLTNGVEVYRSLDELKAIKAWNPDGKDLTEKEREYLRFFNSLAPLYQGFRQALLESGEVYFGLAFSQLILQIESTSFADWDRIFFAGFNALTKAEETLFIYLTSIGKAEVLWDADRYYLEDERQEAGQFLRRYIHDAKYGSPQWITDSLRTENKEINIYGIPGNVGQAKWAGQLVSSLISQSDPSDLALILIDETLLLPVLNSMPSETGQYNVTMGYPLRITPAYSLIDSLFQLFINALKRKASEQAETQPGLNSLRFHTRDIDRFLSHEYLHLFYTETNDSNAGRKQQALKVYYNINELKNKLENGYPLLNPFSEQLLKLDMTFPGEIIQVSASLIDMIHKVSAGSVTDSTRLNGMDNEYLFQVAQLLKRIAWIARESNLIGDMETLYELFSSQAGGMRIPFYGEPLKGIQVMGMLETRTLDFRRQILLSVNEGSLPKGKSQNTFIPDEIRKAFGLHRYHDRNAVFAYHFYRLLQRGEEIYLLYTTEGNELGGGERSRFITQIINELPKYNPGIVIKEKVLSISPGASPESVISIPKEGAVLEKLIALSARGISPTSLSTFLSCSLQYCFSHILGLQELDQPEESIDAALLGESLHQVLQDAYTPYLGKKLSVKDLSTIRQSALENLRLAFRAKNSTVDLEFGKNLLIMKVAAKMLNRFFQSEIDFLSNQEPGNQVLEILQLEDWLDYEIELGTSLDLPVSKVKLHGKVDRIDKVNTTTRIIDYKSGQISKTELKIKSIEELTDSESPSKLLQLLTYGLLFGKMNPGFMASEKPLVSGIISLRFASRYFIGAAIGESQLLNKGILEEFEEVLRGILIQLFDREQPFIQTKDQAKCKNCPYKKICNREINE